MADKINIQILGDGRIRTETDAVSPVNHKNADDFIKYMQELAGGTTEVEQKKKHSHSTVSVQQKVGR